MSFNPGLIIRHDIRNEKFLVRDHTHILGLAAPGEVAAPFIPKKKHWRNEWPLNDQGQTPRCSAFGSLTAIACTPVPHTGVNPVLDPQAMYEENQRYDVAHGYEGGEGATTIAAMETLKAHGIIRGYYWGYTMDDLFRALAKKVAVAGTWWYPSMFERDAQGVIRVNDNVPTQDGHLYAIHGYDPATGLLDIAQTWGDGDYYISADDFYKLLRRDGEIAVMDEIRPRTV